MSRAPLRILTALLLIGGAALLAGRSGSLGLRVALLAAAALIGALLLRPRLAPPGQGREETERTRPAELITRHPAFPLMLDATADPALVLEHERVVQANLAAQQLFGARIVGSDIRAAIRHAGAIERILDPHATHRGQPLRIAGLGRRDQNWDMRIRSIGDGVKYVQLVDRTEAQASERMRVDFVANASHELLTPLTAIRGFVETLSETDAAEDAETRAHFLSIVAREARRMQSLVQDLMSLSRIESEKHLPVAARLDFGPLVEEVIATLADSTPERSRDFLVEVEEDLPPLLGDRPLLMQLVYNIVSNSMKYGRPGTPVRVSLHRSRSGNMLCLSVEDESEGISPEHIPRLTERFYRVDSGRSRQLGGTGLGLSLVKHIVDRHRGHLEILSEIGRGTRVNVLLPIAPHEIAADVT